jgi:hypothetical protein
LLLLYYLQYGPIIELTSFDEQALVYWTLWAKKSSKDDITLCCEIMGALTTFLLYKGAILIGPSAIFWEH